MTSTTKSSIPFECILLRPFEIRNNVVIFTEQFDPIATQKANIKAREIVTMFKLFKETISDMS